MFKHTGGRSKRASTAASTKATDFLQKEAEPRLDEARTAIWNKRNHIVIQGWKAPMSKNLAKVFKMMNFVSKIMNFVSKIMTFALK